MKTEMKMLDNGNYESVISPLQHECQSKDCNVRCVEYGWDLGKIKLKVEVGDPYEDGFDYQCEVMCCPFCGYTPKKRTQ